MRTLLAILAGVIGAPPLAACASAEGQVSPSATPAPGAGADPTPAPTGGPVGPIVLELFTSQGCSSCPPADRHLAELAREGQVGGRAVAPLSFHVDYWNDLGWTDPFSQPAWTERQRQYARALGDRLYTPELVVGGAVGMVGSQARKIAAAIAAAPAPTLLPATATWDMAHLEVTATAPADADVLVAVWEEARTVAVPRGENAGETLTNYRVVRRLERVAAAGQQGTHRIALDPTWKDTGAVVFAQRPDRRIIASALLHK